MGFDVQEEPFGANAGSTAEAVDQGVARANGQEEADETEQKAVAKLWDEYQIVCDFDDSFRKQVLIDRLYAAGEADAAYASDANLIGSFIDILVSFLYAKDPDVSARAAKRVGSQPDKDATLFAETMEIVISRLWKDARLKAVAKKWIRSTLSVSLGWFKAVVFSQKGQDPQIEGRIRTAQDTMKRLKSLQNDLDAGEYVDRELKVVEIEETIAGLKSQLEAIVRAGMHIDFVRAEDMKVSLDVANVMDHTDADWNSNDLYVTKEALKERFPDLTAEDVKGCATYYQQNPKIRDANTLLAGEGRGDEDAVFSKGSNGNVVGGKKPVEFAKIVELWDKRDGLVKTMVEGVKRWAIDPFPPPQASTRFYPYFGLALYMIDGRRVPQSLSKRLAKLQDEYSACRSGQKLTRARNIPGTIFNKAAVTVESMTRLENSVHMENVGVDMTNPNAKLSDFIMSKPQANIDARMWDSSAIKSDMEVISGVQEALSQSVSTAKTATEAGIEQSGFQSRTGADRDEMEDVLTDFAQYTAQCSIQEVPEEWAKKIAGPLAFWPYGMDVEDVLHMCNVDIKAGSTGKPNQAAERQSWSIVLPQLQAAMAQYRQMILVDPEGAKALKALMRETLKRLDDRLDIDEFMPEIAPLVPPALPGGPGMPGAPGLPGPGGIQPSNPGKMDSQTPVPPADAIPA